MGLPEVMPAAVYKGPGHVEVDLIAVPIPEPGQVLVEVGHCGVCGSDLHMMVEGWGKPGFVGGHESSGVVAALGEGVTNWKLGDRVILGPSPRCGTCRRCRESKPSQCENRSTITGGDAHSGSFARYTIARTESLIAMPENMSERVAALAEPLAVALHGITRSGAAPGDTAMVFGAGPIGALTIAALVARRHRPCDRSRARGKAQAARARGGRRRSSPPRRARDLPPVGAGQDLRASRRRGARVLG